MRATEWRLNPAWGETLRKTPTEVNKNVSGRQSRLETSNRVSLKRKNYFYFFKIYSIFNPIYFSIFKRICFPFSLSGFSITDF
jgi:hypothetical protein